MASVAATAHSVVNRYLAGQFASLLLPILAGIRAPLRHHRPVRPARHPAPLTTPRVGAAAIRYFLFKIPLMLTQITPPAVITARAARLRPASAGATRSSPCAPAASASCKTAVAGRGAGRCAISVARAGLERDRRSLLLAQVPVREQRRDPKACAARRRCSDRAIWYHGGDGFYNIDYVDRAQQAVFDVTIYRLDGAFRLRSVVQRAARGLARRAMAGAPTRSSTRSTDGIGEQSVPCRRAAPSPRRWTISSKCSASPRNSASRRLRERIDDLTRKGIDASHYLVDLYLKLALPFASTGAGGWSRCRSPDGCAAIRASRRSSGWGRGRLRLLGRCSVSRPRLGQTGALPPLMAAWAANGSCYLLVVAPRSCP